MSNFQKKYYYDFKSIDNKSHTVEIWQDSSSAVSSTKIIGAVEPFTVTLSSLSDKLQTVRGTGADLNLFATSSLQFMDLYTADMQEYQVRHYIDSSLNWTGYLDTEIFSSDFSRQKNYNVAITANDGFALLDRMNYVQDASGTKFTGITSQWDVLKFIIQKLNLPVTYLYVALSTTITGVTNAVSDTTFHNTYVMNSNYYDEDGEAATLREVLEGTLKPYGAFIQQSNGDLYISDTNLLAGTETDMKVYDASTFGYLSTTALNKNIGDLSTLDFMSPNQTLNIVPGINKQVVAYSPYVQENIIEVDAKNDFSVVNWSAGMGTAPYTWLETFWTNCTNWTKSNYGKFCSYVGTNEENIDKNDAYFKMTKYTTNDAIPENLSFTYTGTLPIIIPSNSKIKITAQAYCRMSDDLDNPDSGVPDWASIYWLVIRCRLKIGDKQYYSQSTATRGWTTLADNRSLDFVFENKFIELVNGNPFTKYNILDNQWLNLKQTTTAYYPVTGWQIQERDFLIPLDSGFSGDILEFEIYDWDIKPKYDANQAINHDAAKNAVKDIRIKDLTLTIVDEYGDEFPTEDIEYVGYMNAQYKNEGSKIELIQGTNTSGSPVERGTLLKIDASSYAPISSWTRGATTDIIENLLLRSYVGNYENKSIELSVKTKHIPTNIGYLTYNAYLSGKKLMPISITNDYANNTSEMTMQEIFPDSLNINKSF